MRVLLFLIGLLALVGVPEADGAAFPIANFTCRQGSQECAEPAVIQQLPEANGLAGIKMFVEGPLVFHNTCEGNECFDELSTLQLNVIGLMSGIWASGATIPITWDFTISFDETVAFDRWEFNAGITSNLQQTSVSATGTSGGQITGSGTLTSFGIPDGQPMLIYSQLLLYWMGQPTSSVTVTVPGNSIDFGVVPTAGVPEPGTAMLLVAGLFVAGLVRSR